MALALGLRLLGFASMSYRNRPLLLVAVELKLCAGPWLCVTFRLERHRP